MPATCTGVASTAIVAVCSVPASGDFVTGAGLMTACQAINDDLATISTGNCTMSGAKTFPDLRATVAASQSLILTNETSLVKLGTGSGFVRTRVRTTASRDDGNWTIDGFNTRTATNASVPAIYYDVEVPHAATITDVWLFLTAPGAHIGLPATLPSVRLNIQDITADPGQTTAGPQVDTSASLLAYETAHSVHLAAVGHTYDATRERLTVEVHGEGGADALVGDVVRGVYVTFTQPHL